MVPSGPASGTRTSEPPSLQAATRTSAAIGDRRRAVGRSIGVTLRRTAGPGARPPSHPIAGGGGGCDAGFAEARGILANRRPLPQYGCMASRSRPPKLVRPRVSPDAEAMFLGAIGGVVPLVERDRVPPPVPVRSGLALASPLPPTQVLVVEGGPGEQSARAAGVNRAQVAELRRGKVRAEATL